MFYAPGMEHSSVRWKSSFLELVDKESFHGQVSPDCPPSIEGANTHPRPSPNPNMKRVNKNFPQETADGRQADGSGQVLRPSRFLPCFLAQVRLYLYQNFESGSGLITQILKKRRILICGINR